METKNYIVRDREAGNFIEAFGSREEAQRYVDQAEADDKADGIYVKGFYEIIEG